MARHKTHHKPYHEQVPFRTLDGDWVQVDEGIFFVLNMLQSNLGIRTLYSCEGHPDFGTAYIMMTARNARKLEKILWRGYRKNRYSAESMAILEAFAKGTYMSTIVVLWRQKTQTGRKRLRTVWTRKRVVRRPGKYAVERTISNLYGMRTSYRWPKEDTPLILEALREASQDLHGS